MPEGDTIFRAARTLHRALAGRVVTRFESVYPALTRVADDHPVIGRQIEGVTSRGKHLLMTFSGGLILHTHMRMNGSWHIYRPGERWQRPARDMRVVVGTDDFVAVGFNVPVAALLTPQQLARHPELRALGPDLLTVDAPGTRTPGTRTPGTRAPGTRALGTRAPSTKAPSTKAPSTKAPSTKAPSTKAPSTKAPSTDHVTPSTREALRRMRAHDRQAIADVLLNQRVVAGIGNVLKSEILFVAGFHPFRSVASLSDAELLRAIEVSRQLLEANVMTSAQTLSPSIGRRTTRRLNPNEKLWVYSRGGQPCRRCGARIESRKTGLDARLTYWCPQCQT
jgi:endonuclease-8